MPSHTYYRLRELPVCFSLWYYINKMYLLYNSIDTFCCQYANSSPLLAWKLYVGWLTTPGAAHLLKARYTKIKFSIFFFVCYVHIRVICRWGHMVHHFYRKGFFGRHLFLSLSPVLHLLLYSGPGVMLGVPEDQLWAEDGGDACCRGDLQHHHPSDTCLFVGWIQQSTVPHRWTG